MADPRQRGRLTRWLESAPTPVLVAYAIVAAFSTYFCMYAFRKPFAASSYSGLELWGAELKTVFVISQILGYMLSKYIGIKVCSEMTRGWRALSLVSFILLAEGALWLFAVCPPQLKVVAIFLNGLPLGMVWGLVVWYLEGRRTSEILLAGLSCSFIVASGIVKDLGRALLRGFTVRSWVDDDGFHFDVTELQDAVDLPDTTYLLDFSIQTSEWWMPVVAGLFILPAFLVSVWLLNQIPEPTEEDIAARVEREPMDGRERLSFVVRFLPGLILLLIVYLFLTAYRDFRDNYGVEIFAGLGYTDTPALFTEAELIVAFGVMVALALLVLIKDNRLGLLGAYLIMIGGVALMSGSSLLLEAGVIDGFWWMTLVGLGSYLTYVPYGSVFFDRLIASTGVAGTAVFAIYVADAIGYTGSVGVQLYKDFAHEDVSRLGFFKGFTWFLSILGVVLLVISAFYFMAKTRRERRPPSSQPSPQG